MRRRMGALSPLHCGDLPALIRLRPAPPRPAPPRPPAACPALPRPAPPAPPCPALPALPAPACPPRHALPSVTPSPPPPPAPAPGCFFLSRNVENSCPSTGRMNSKVIAEFLYPLFLWLSDMKCSVRIVSAAWAISERGASSSASALAALCSIAVGRGQASFVSHSLRTLIRSGSSATPRTREFSRNLAAAAFAAAAFAAAAFAAAAAAATAATAVAVAIRFN
ncbi:Protein of unknown function [Gryllus bimaculatus]|nr:Protein of unknown function [Gryllus bimaculatus]